MCERVGEQPKATDKMWARASALLRFSGQLWQQARAAHQHRTLKTLTASCEKEEVWTHADIPTPKRLPILGTTLDIIAAGSGTK